MAKTTYLGKISLDGPSKFDYFIVQTEKVIIACISVYV